MRRPDSGRGGWPLGLLGMLAMVAGVERWVVAHDLDFTTASAADWSTAARAAGKVDRRTTLLCLGDSLVKYGLIPDALDASLGGRSANLAVQGARAPAAYFQLRRALAAGARPSAVVVDYDGYHLGRDPDDLVRLWAELATPRDMVELARDAGSASMLAAYLVARALPSAKSRFEARQDLLAALAGRPHPRRDAIPPLWRTWRRNRGAQPMPPAAGPPGEVLMGDVPWEPTYVNRIYVDKFMRLAAAHGIAVRWLIPPTRPDVQAARDRLSAEPAYTAFVRRALDRYPNLTILDARHSGYPASAFHDLTHLDRRGAAALSRDLAAMLRGPLGRYSPLPPFRGFDGEGPEDIEQARLALEARARR